MENNKKSEKPALFLVLKIIGFCLLGIGVMLLIAGIATPSLDMGDSGWFEAESLKMGIISGGMFCIIPSIALIIAGFHPQISKTMIKTTKYIQEDNKQDLKDIANTSAEISEEAITRTVRAVKKGFQNTKFCRHCGTEILEDSKFCSKCGKEQ